MKRIILIAALFTIALIPCNLPAQVEIKPEQKAATSPSVARLTLKSPAFKGGGMIPRQYTCDSLDISPSLFWSKPPSSARSLALICDDPDAPGGTWIHWVIYNIPVADTTLAGNIAKKDTVGSMIQGKNSFGNIGYGGPCPPAGKPHRYYFHLCAIDTILDLAPGSTDKDVMNAITGHIVAMGELMGRYGR
jgi:Raf kinase inhibitor-like YbhB/YbcL family protein